MRITENFRLKRGAAIALRGGLPCWGGVLDRFPADIKVEELVVNPLDVERARGIKR